jgi:peptidoglycan hydrolase-like protein with peptidoglycan-binding domain
MPVAPVTTSPAPSSSTPTPAATHVVRAGDTLWGIARTHGTDVATLRQHNPPLRSMPDDALPVGMHLSLGTAAATTTTTATASGATSASGGAAATTTSPSGTAAATAATSSGAPRAPADAATVQGSRQAAQAADAAARARVGDTAGTRLEALVQRGELLRQGASGPEVVDLQRFLGMKTVEQDGQFGPRTAQVLQDFQRRASLTPDGVVGQQTLAALKQTGAVTSDARDLQMRIETGNPVREGESGPHVRAVQRLLGFGPAGVTGVFGPTTRAAVEDVQRKMLGMTPESPGWGGVGPLTWQTLRRAEDVRQSSSSAAVAGAPAGHMRILAQQDATSCGLTSVAMVTNAWNKSLGTGARPITDRTLRAEMGQADLRRAMTNHLPPGVTHYDRDWPRGARSFTDIDAQLAKGNPVIVGVGRPFTASGYGHIFVLNKKNADGSYDVFDPNGAVRRNVSQQALATAGEHREGSFYMVAERR